MKKIYYLFALLPLAFTACQKQPNLLPATYTKAMNLTLAQSDYQLLPSTDYPHSTFTFDNVTDANTYIPIILNSRDPQLGNGSTAKVTYTNSAPYLKLTDSLFADVAYTMTAADYTASASVTGTTYKDYSAAQVLLYLTYKYPTPVKNQLSLLTYTYYQSGATPSAGVTETDSFLFLNGAWQKIYTLSAAQYTTLGRGSYDEILSTDAASLPSYFNTLLKADPTVAATAQVGNIEYVSYKYYASGTYQRVLPLIFDGNNWVTTATTTNTLAFVKSNGTWIADPTVYYTLGKADFTLIGASSIGTATGRSNYAQYGDFNTSVSSQYYWLPADIQKAIVLVLTTDFPKPKINVNYNVTYLLYVSGNDVTTVVTYKNNGTAWVQQ